MSALVLGSALLIFLVALSDRTIVDAAAPGALSRLMPAILANGGAALVAALEGAITPGGATAGVALGTLIYMGGGWEAWLLLGATFVTAVLASHAGRARKRALGIAQEDEGRRGARHVAANCSVAAAAAVAAVTSPYQSAAWAALAGALTAAGADTAASEVGKAWGRRTVLIVGWRPVPAGTAGAISMTGSLANFAAALFLALFSAALGLIGIGSVPAVTVAALAGSATESVLAAAFEHRGILDNHQLNFINTAVAATCAVYLM